MLGDYSYVPTPVNNNEGDAYFKKGVLALVIAIVTVGLLYLAWTLFAKDCILLFKARRQRTTTEIGFGGTPAHRNGVVGNNNNAVNNGVMPV